MQPQGFVAIADHESKDIYGGSFLALLGVIPGLVSAAIGIVHLFRSFKTTKGEVKTKDYQYKWDNSELENKARTKSAPLAKSPVYFSY